MLARRNSIRVLQFLPETSEEMRMKHIVVGGLLVAGLFAIPAQPVFAQSIDIGPGGVRLDPRTPRERERDEIRREERREEFREERRDAIRRERRLQDDDDDD